MKRILIALGSVLVLASCDNKPYAIISGKVTAPQYAGGSVNLIANDTVFKSIKIGQDGTFADTIKTFSGDKNLKLLASQLDALPIYLKKGTELKLDGEAFSLATITGKNNEETLFLKEKNTYFREDFNPSHEAIFSKEDADFKKEIDTEFEKLSSKLSVPNIDKDFQKEQKTWLDHQRYLMYFYYPSYNQYFTEAKEAKPLNEIFKKELNSVDFDNEEYYKKHSSYKGLIQNYYMTPLQDNMDKPNEFALELEKIKKIKSPSIRKDISVEVASFLTYVEENLNETIIKFVRESADIPSEIKQQTEQTYTAKLALKPGSPAPSFNYENHKGGTTSLESLKGKVVYIDVWATWCGPCIAEIEPLKKLEEEFKGKNVAFVGISIDDLQNREKWSNFIKDRQLAGIQLLAENAWQSKICKDYLIFGIPRFILIDKNGNLVKSDAPRPSQATEIKNLLNSLL